MALLRDEKTLALLLLAPLAYSEVYTFECKDKKIGTIISLLINTDKKFISVNGGKILRKLERE